jgi:hypothetical protein
MPKTDFPATLFSISKMRLSSVCRGRHSAYLMKNDCQPVGTRKTRQSGDGRHGQVRVGQELLGLQNPSTTKFFEHRAAQDRTELSLQFAPPDARGADDACHIGPFDGRRMDDAKGGDHRRIANGHRIGRLAHYHPDRRKKYPNGGRSSPRHGLIQQFCRLVTDAFARNGDARKRR